MIEEPIYERYFAHLAAGDRRPCSEIVQALLDRGEDLGTIYTDLFQRSLYRIGDLWERGRISVAVEHLATALTESLLTLSYPLLFARPRQGRSAVISCVANETHQIGGKMAADILELNGWDTWFLGANTPVADLVGLVREKKPDVVGLSLSLYFRMPELEAAVRAVRAERPEQRIVVGGQAFRWGGREAAERLGRVRCVDSIVDLEAILHGA